MRIAMLGPFGFHPNKTMRSRALSLARPLVRAGHTVHIIMPPWHTPQEAGTTWREDGVWLTYVSLAGGILPTVGRMIRTAVSLEPHAVHAFKPKAHSGLTMWGLWRMRRFRPQIRLITDTDDWEGWGGWNELSDYSAVQKHFFAWQEKWGLTHCHALTVASRALQTLAWANGAPADRVHYLPNGPGIATPPHQTVPQRQKLRRELGLHPDQPTVLLYSRLFEFDTGRLTDILAAVRRLVPDLAILSVGAGLFADDAADLRRRWKSADLLDCVIDVGWQPEEELPHLLQTADVGLYLMDDTLLNRTKCPVKLADMAHVGLPVVAEAVGQVRDYIRAGHTGRLRPCGDVVGLTDDLVDLLTHPQKATALGRNAARHIHDHFNWETHAETLAAIYAGDRP